MQTDKAQKIRKAWGDRPCDHPSFDKEYYLGSDTGDWICEQCGRAFDREEKDEIKLNRAKND